MHKAKAFPRFDPDGVQPLPGSNRARNPKSAYHGEANGSSPIELTLALRGPPLPDFADKSFSGLSKTSLAAKFGASKPDAARVCKVMRGFGFGIAEVNLAARSIVIKGTVAQAKKAFEPQLAMYKNADQGIFRDRIGTYGAPASVSGIVCAVMGLSQRRILQRKPSSRKKVASAKETLPTSRPEDIEKIYDFPEGSAAGQKIAIAEFGGGYFASDLRAYCRKFKRNMPDVSTITVNRPAYTLRQINRLSRTRRAEELDSSIEVMMDVEIIAGLCPRAKIQVYFANFDQKGWVDLLDKVIVDRPVALSISWGLAEDSRFWTAAARTAINERLALAAASGITVCVASGDDGTGDMQRGHLAHVDFPSSSPFVLSVGGTMLKPHKHQLKEVTWWDAPGKRKYHHGGSTGGGVSRIFDRPAWQKIRVKVPKGGANSGRVVPDVAALATGPRYDLIVLGKDYPRGGGTSASAPVWAALIARIAQKLPKNKRQRFLTPLLYRKGANGKAYGAQVCHDITVGNNRSDPPGFGYRARRGYDAVTGWGSPKGKALLAMLRKLK